MGHQHINIKTNSQDTRDILIAILSEQHYDGFEETEDGISAYIDDTLFDTQTLKELLEPLGLEYMSAVIEKQNWNALWESNFQPVTVAGFCTVRASFHDIQIDTPYEIVINPKMSFGTGHHATTQLMMQHMQKLDFKDGTVLDFGAGTGILSILASKLGAASVVAVDHEEWAAENALDNMKLNGTDHNVEVILGSIEQASDKGYDIILANINRHILLQYMAEMRALIVAGGTILMSGILETDEHIIREAAESNGLTSIAKLQKDNWIALSFKA